MIKERRLRTIADMTRLEHRIWSYTAIVDDNESCWQWEGATTPYGDPITSWKSVDGRPATDEEAVFKGAGKTQSYQVRRLLLWLMHGEWQRAGDTCDNPSCVRPRHLRPRD
jgi:hypothetical protein